MFYGGQQRFEKWFDPAPHHLAPDCSLLTTLSRAKSKPTHALMDAMTLVQSGFVAGFPSANAFTAATTTATIPPAPNSVVLQLALILFFLLLSDFAARYGEQVESPVVKVSSRVSKHFNQKRLAAKNGATDCTADQSCFYGD